MSLNDSRLRANPLNKLVFKFIDDAKRIFNHLEDFSKDDEKRFVNEEKGFFQFCPNQNMYLKPNLLLICDFDPGNYRLLAMMSTLPKVFEKVLDSRIGAWSERVGALSDLQGGFRDGRGRNG